MRPLLHCLCRRAAALVLASGALVSGISPAPGQADLRFQVDYSPVSGSPDGFSQVILDPYARKAAAPEDTTRFAYLSLVEIANGAPYEADARQRGLIFDAPASTTWNSHFAKVSDPAWRSYFIETLAGHAVKQGFDGFFLDTADSLAHLPGADDSDQLAQYRKQLAGLITALHDAHPERPIILNRGFGLLDLLPEGTLHGVLIESVFQTYDFEKKAYRATAEGDTKVLVEKIRSLRRQGLQVQVIDYVDPSQPDLARETARRIAALDAAALVTTPDLQGLVLAPNTAAPRKILVLYGFDSALTGRFPIWPPDTEVARQLQPALEWMGYDLRFHHATKQTLPEINGDDYAGIILDTGIALPMQQELRYVNWLIEQKEQGMKLLVCGTYPFRSEPARQKLFTALGVRQLSSARFQARNVRITHKDEDLCDFEREIKPLPRGFVDAAAPGDATPHLTLLAEDEHGRTRRFDPHYTASWGGALQHPYWNFQPSFNDSYALVDPFAFLQKVFPAGEFPAPDTTTRNGLRLLWAHIDGDGFPTLSTLKRGATCAEVMRDRILTKYPIPTTVSVIEGEIRALQTTQKPETAAKLTDLAKEILALPYIEAASHAYSHPFVWSDQDVSPHDNYEHPCLKLRCGHAMEKICPRREVVGSVEYIERELLPPGKKVKIMLWSGNCRPFPEALRYTRELGIENMNGGFTVYSKRHPQLSAVAPRNTWWDDQIQIYAGNQNDYVYTNDWSGPTYGGFEQVIDSFIKLDEGRRLKGVNIYYHFYSAAYSGALTALERIHDWAMDQPLHAVTASEAASLTRGAIHARLHRTGSQRWLLTSHGTLSTFRLPIESGYPDLAASTNILGYNEHLGQRYIQTNGAEVVELVLADKPQRHLYLRTAEGKTDFEALLPERATFTLSTLKPSPLCFGGVAPGSAWAVTFTGENGAPQSLTVTADKDGHLDFILPHSTTATLAPARSTASR